MFIDLSCPAELFRTALPTEEDPSCQLLLYNLSDRIIVSVEVNLHLLNRRGEDEEHLVYRARALNGRPQTAFTMRVPCTPSAAIARAEVTIEKVWFSDNAVWRRESGREVSYTPNHLPVSRGLTNLRYVAGESAVGYPSQQEGLWVCVCGRPNPDAEEYCVRCRREKSLIFARYNREAVEKQLNQKERQLELQTRSAREDTSRMQRIREEAYQTARQKKSRRLHLASAMLAAVAACALALGAGVPAARMAVARRVMQEGRPEEAREILEELGSFPGAAPLLADANYSIAEQVVLSGDQPDDLAAAAETLRADGREGAEALARDADYRRASLLLAAADYAGSRDAARSLPNTYPGIRELQQETDYQEALQNMRDRFYVLARNAFLKLGDYRDAADQADACIYLPALSLIENGEYDAARTQLERIPTYEDSAELILKCFYLKGLALEKKEDYAGAADAYFAAGEYEDAAEKARELTYILAEDAFTAASFEKAAAWYQRIPGYLDADEKALASVYTLARRAISDLEYKKALTLLASLPEDYEDAAELTWQALYALGLDAQEREDWLSAADFFFRASGYRDADRRLDRVLSHLTPEEAAPFLPAEETTEPDETVSPSATEVTPEPVAAPAEIASPAPTETPEPTPTPTETASPAPTKSATPTVTPTATPDPIPTRTAASTLPPAQSPSEATAPAGQTVGAAVTETPVRTSAESPAETPESDSFLVQDEE